MEFFRNLWKNKGLKNFLILFFLFVVTGGILVLVLKHGDIVLLVNKYSRLSWDSSVNLITYLGLGGVLVVVFLLLGFYQLRWTLMGLINLALVGLFTGVLKHLFKANHPRPFFYFSYDDFHRFIYSADLNYYSSFPSGHTMAAFASMSMLAYLAGRKMLGIVFFFVALLIGFSRIYLCQHFLLDVYFGAILGMTSTIITVWIGDHLLNLGYRRAFQQSFVEFFRPR